MTDGNPPAAKTRLDRAITAVFSPIYDQLDGRTVIAPSLYMQLVESIPGITGERSGGTAGMPLWCDAEDLRNAIIVQVATWQPKGATIHERIHAIDERRWRPQDVDTIDAMSTTIESWAISIASLLYPTPKWTLPAACPNCQTAIVHRKDSAGDVVRQAALQIDHHGCVCQKCRTRWTPDLFAHLARVLGYSPDTSVLA